MDLAKELEILQPDREVDIAGEKIAVREYTWTEAIGLGRIAAPLIEDLNRLFSDAEPTLDGLMVALEGHKQSLFELISKAIDRPVEWIEKLSDADGLLLLHVFWRVNSGFFVRRLVMRRASRPIESA